MNTHNIRLVQESFAKVAPIAETAAELFYHRLFELDGNLRHLFHSDIKQQGQRLMHMVGTAVHHLDDLDTLVPVARKLGARHKIYGVEPSHYHSVGEALLWTLEQGLGDDFTPEVADAWATTYGLLAGVMQEAADAADHHASGLQLSPA